MNYVKGLLHKCLDLLTTSMWIPEPNLNISSSERKMCFLEGARKFIYMVLEQQSTVQLISLYRLDNSVQYFFMFSFALCLSISFYAISHAEDESKSYMTDLIYIKAYCRYRRLHSSEQPVASYHSQFDILFRLMRHLLVSQSNRTRLWRPFLRD